MQSYPTFLAEIKRTLYKIDCPEVSKAEIMPEYLIRHARKADCPALARVLITATRDTFRGLVPDHCLNWITPEESATNWVKNFAGDQRLKDGSWLYAAESKANDVIGFALLIDDSKIGEQDPPQAKLFAHELRVIQIDPAWQRKGVGRALIARGAEQIREEGGSNCLVRVLAENPNRAFYEHLGAVRLGKRPYDWAGYQTQEIIYGWYNLDDLL